MYILRKKRVVKAIISFALIISSAVSVYANNRHDLIYSPSKFNNSWLIDRVNCYGYSLQVYNRGAQDWNGYYYDYKQQPGEFYNNTETFNNLMNSYYYSFNYWYNQYNFIKDRIQEDCYTLGYSFKETYETGTIAQSNTANGVRKIALVWGPNDYHFYAQNSDGTWSHKPGSTAVKNTSISSGYTLTNSNIYTRAAEGIYTSGPVFFEISKDAVTDYPHLNGHGNSTYTSTSFREKAGDLTYQSSIVGTGTKSAYFDYADDVDYYKFVPSTSRNYTISTSASSTDIDGEIFNSSGGLVVSDLSTANFSVSVFMSAGSTYYIRLYDYKDTTNDYSLTIY